MQFLSQQTWSEAKKHAKQVALGRRVPLPGDLPPSLAQLVVDCWEQDPLRRPSVSDVVDRL